MYFWVETIYSNNIAFLDEKAIKYRRSLKLATICVRKRACYA